MNHRLKTLCTGLFVWSQCILGQVSLSLPDTTVPQGAQIALPVWVAGFNNVGSFSLTISFDKSVLQYTGVVNQPGIGNFFSTPATTANNSGAVNLSWFSANPSLSIEAGKLLDLLFTYNGGTSTVAFTNTVPSSVTDASGSNLQALYRNGRVRSQAVSAIEGGGAIPGRHSLGQNYPNPFNPTTAISFQLSTTSQVALKVYDVLGRGITTLVSEVRPPGTYTVHWDGSALPSGVYYYRLQALSIVGLQDPFIETRKMVLSK